MNDKDKALLDKARNLENYLEDFKEFIKKYEADEEEDLINEHGKKCLDYIISEIKDIVDVLK